jgi:hypothetical protein
MSIVVRFNPTSLTAETYDEGTRQLEEAGVEVRQLAVLCDCLERWAGEATRWSSRR